MIEWLNKLIRKLSKPHWTPKPVWHYINNSEGLEGQFNIAWVLWGRPQVILQTVFTGERLDYWYLAGRVCETKVDNIPVKEYATLLTPDEFYDFICANPAAFERHMPMTFWERHFSTAKHERTQKPGRSS